MYIDYENMNPIFEDFTDILLDYDIACEGTELTAMNIIKKGLELIKKIWTQICNFIITKIKTFKKTIQTKREYNSIKLKPGIKMSISNWDLDNIVNMINKFFGAVDQSIDKIPIENYKRALESTLDEFVYTIIDDLNRSAELLHSTGISYNFQDIENTAYEREMKYRFLLNSDTDQTKEIVFKYINSMNMLEELNRLVTRYQSETTNRLRKVSENMDNITKSMNKIDGNILAKKELVLAMRSYVSSVCTDIQEGMKKFTRLFDKFSDEFIKVCNIAQ
jgi:methyl-accepting chemotaxis protein